MAELKKGMIQMTDRIEQTINPTKSVLLMNQEDQAIRPVQSIGYADSVKTFPGIDEEHKIAEVDGIEHVSIKESDNAMSFFNRTLTNVDRLRYMEALNELRPDLLMAKAPEESRCMNSTGEKLAGHAIKHAKGNGRHCFRYVKKSLEHIEVYVGGKSAFMAANMLAYEPAFKEVKGLSNDQLSDLPAGSIVVWNRSKRHKDGHISISLGDGREASDVIRDQLTEYGTGFRVFAPVNVDSSATCPK